VYKQAVINSIMQQNIGLCRKRLVMQKHSASVNEATHFWHLFNVTAQELHEVQTIEHTILKQSIMHTKMYTHKIGLKKVNATRYKALNDTESELHSIHPEINICIN